MRKEVNWTITNAISGGTDEQIKFLVDQGFLDGLVGLLEVYDQKVFFLFLFLFFVFVFVFG